MDRNKIKTLASSIYIKPSEKVIDLTLFLYQKIRTFIKSKWTNVFIWQFKRWQCW